MSRYTECEDLLYNMVIKACNVEDDVTLDSMCSDTYADAMRFLAKHKRILIVKESGRRVIGRII